MAMSYSKYLLLRFLKQANYKLFVILLRMV